MDGDEATAAEEWVDEGDYDRLIYGEAGLRLTEEIHVQRSQLADLLATGDQASVEACQQRLDAMVAAEERNIRRTFDEGGFRAMVGYVQRPVRNNPKNGD